MGVQCTPNSLLHRMKLIIKIYLSAMGAYFVQYGKLLICINVAKEPYIRF